MILLKKAVRFCFVGALVFALDFALIWLLQQIVPVMVAVSTAYLIAVATHFCLNKWWVFHSRQSAAFLELKRYVVSVALCWLTTLVLVASALAYLTSNVYLAKLIALVPTTLLSFMLLKTYVFPGGQTAGGRS